MATTEEPVLLVPDAVDRCLAAWDDDYPDIDLATEALVSRISKLARYFERSLGQTASAYGLTIGDWELLSSLRRVGPPYRMSPGQLAEALIVSPGAMTSHLDRLEKRGLVQRHPDARDRRGIQVELTPEGRKTWDEAVEVAAAKESMVADSLDAEQKATVNDLLKRLMVYFESMEGPAPTKTGPTEKEGRDPRT